MFPSKTLEKCASKIKFIVGSKVVNLIKNIVVFDYFQTFSRSLLTSNR